jgi:hypothetical protein
MAEQGFRGVFGLDFVMADDGRAYLIEVNPRLVASIALFTQLEAAAGRLPLLARHILAFLDPEADRAPLDGNAEPVQGGQVILHNLGHRTAQVARTVDAGACRLSGGALVGRRPALVAGELAPDEWLVLSPQASRPVSAGGAWGRLQTAAAVASSAGELLPATAEAVAALGSAVALGALSEVAEGPRREQHAHAEGGERNDQDEQHDRQRRPPSGRVGHDDPRE